eukprot:GHVS01005690.1.p1 GENE.GHVS01005690.1~~GHVS01005690.1.p1  ORF type:complete len:188 (+),score=16.19 GHVS01005690.1:182-745(+)
MERCVLTALFVIMGVVAGAQDSVEPFACDECPSKHEPVCGSNGVTYENLCDLGRTNCIYGADLTVLFHSACEDGEDEATPLGGDGCGEACVGMWDPVCGTDHRNYNSPCMLAKSACSFEVDVTVKHKGLCRPDETPIDVCRHSCPVQLNPMCGTDNQTYTNECVLKMTACRKRKPIQVQHTGICSVS